MGAVWLCTDWHLTHRNMAMKYRPRMGSVEEHDEFFVKAWKDNVKARDKVICLGDMATSIKGNAIMGSLPAEQKHLVLGNHDLDNGCSLSDLMKVYDKITGPEKYKEFWLTHFPIHQTELRGKINLHGHIHGSLIDDSRYINLCPEILTLVLDRPIIKLDELRNLIKTNEYLDRIKAIRGY